MGTNVGDEPRDMTVFQPFLQPAADGSQVGWVSSLALAKRAPERHDVVLRNLRKAKEDSGLGAAHNFVEGVYLDRNGQERPLILISEIAMPLVLGYLGGPVYAPIVIAIGEDWRRHLTHAGL